VDQFLDHLLEGAAAAGVDGVEWVFGPNSTATIGSHLHMTGSEIDVDGVPLDIPEPGATIGSLGDPLMQDAARPMSPSDELPAQSAGQQAQNEVHLQRLLDRYPDLPCGITRPCRYTGMIGAHAPQTRPSACPSRDVQQQCTGFAEATHQPVGPQLAEGQGAAIFPAGGSPQQTLLMGSGQSAVPDQAQGQEAEGQLGTACRAATLQPLPSAGPALNTPAHAPTTAAASGLQDQSPGVASCAHQERIAPARLAMQASQPVEARSASVPQQQLPGDGDAGFGSIHGAALTESPGVRVLPTAGAPAVPSIGDVPPAVVPPVEGVLPPSGDECQLPDGFAESYGITSTQVLTTSKAPVWWVWDLHGDGSCYALFAR
jgi:hypothetical protein